MRAFADISGLQTDPQIVEACKYTEENLSEEKTCEHAKKALRREVLRRRAALNQEERERAALLLTERLAGHQWFYHAEYFLGFVGYGSEIDTRGILQEALDRGKKVYVPRVEGEEMVFYRTRSLKELVPGYKGIPEPNGDSEIFLYEETKEKIREGCVLLMMPGVAFDGCRRRMGYGKGYYDRYLACREELAQHTIAVGFQCQRVSEVPVEKHDRRPCQVILI